MQTIAITVCKQIKSNSFKNKTADQKKNTYKSYMYKEDLAYAIKPNNLNLRSSGLI